MKQLIISLILIIGGLSSTGVFADLKVTETDRTVIVQTDQYAVTFDKTKGGTITRLGDREVIQGDSADDYRLAADADPQLAIQKDKPNQVSVTVRAFYMSEGSKAPSDIAAEYRYVFHADSPVVGCYVLIRQDRAHSHADVSLFPSWRKLSVLALGEQVGHSKPFAGQTAKLRLFFKPTADKLFDVPAKEVQSFAELTRPDIPKTKPLLIDELKDKSNWTGLSGNWTIGGGEMAEQSPRPEHAWILAGQDTWKDYIFEAKAHTNDGSSHVYLCARWQDKRNHYALTYLEWPPWTMRIDRVVDGVRMTLVELGALPDLRVQPNTHLALSVRGAQIRAFRNSELLLEAYDSTFTTGRVAVGVVADHRADFRDVQVHELKAPSPEDAIPVITLTQPVSRHAFYREETDAFVPFIVSSDKGTADLTATFVLSHDVYLTWGDTQRVEIKLGKLKAGEKREVKFPLKCRQWRSGDYTLATSVSDGSRVLTRDKMTIYLRRKPNPDRMLVNACDQGDPKLLAENGFNQFKVWHDMTMARWIGDEHRTPDNPERLLSQSAAAKRQHVYDKFDECIKYGMWGYVQIEHTRRVAEGVEEAYALKRNGKELQLGANHIYEQNQRRPNMWHPKNIEVIQDFWRRSLPAITDLPAWHGTLLNSESERTIDVYGNDYWLAMAKKELGFDVPEDATDPWGIRPKNRPLPESGIVESNDPYYRFYRWWHKRGTGEGMLHAKVAEVIKELRPDMVCWHDPALRAAFVRGRLKGQDMLLHWTYCWPSPDRIPLIADEFRLAAVDDQLTVLSLQLIVWRNVALPDDAPRWPYVKLDRFLVAHSPAIMRQTTWMAVSRGIGGISYHAVETVERNGLRGDDDRANVRGVGYRAYMYSNSDTLAAVKDVSEKLIQPYGMVTKRLKPARAKVAFLLSTCNAVLAFRDAMDFKAAEAGRLYMKLQAAHIPMDVVYEIDLEEKGLDGYEAIVLPGCRVLPRHLYDMIHKFASNGGLVIADQYLKAKLPNVVKFDQKVGTWAPGKDIQKEILDESAKVSKALEGKVERWADCDSPSVALSTLVNGPQRLLFATNTLKQPGEYVGQWGRVLDDGTPQETKLRIRRDDRVIYDALAQRRVIPESSDDWLSWNVSLGPAEGRMFAVLPHPIAAVAVNLPGEVAKGTTVRIAVTVTDDRGQPVEGLVPLKVTIADSQNVEHDYSDYAVAREGRAEIALPIAVNEPAGSWSVIVRELYAGTEGRAFFNVGSVAVLGAQPAAPVQVRPGLVPVPEMWAFRRDLDKIGEKDKWFGPGVNKTTWRRISTYQFWNDFVGPFEGDGWYAVDLTIPAVKGKKVWLKFGAVDENYTLWINGNRIGDNLAAGTTMWDKPVAVDITDHYTPGQPNHFVVRVKNTRAAGGIWKPVRVATEE